MQPVAQNYLGVSGYIIFWVSFAVAFGLFTQRVYLLIRLLMLGRKDNRFDRPVYRFAHALAITFSQWCNLRSVNHQDRAGIGHAFMFWGFCLFLFSYIIFIGFGAGFGLSGLLTDTPFERIYSLILDIAALVILAALIWASVRRYLLKPARLKGHNGSEAGVILSLVSSLMILHFLVEGFGLAADNSSALWPPVGAVLANILKSADISQSTLAAWHIGFWWLHYGVILGFLVFIPRSKHLHILASSINVAFNDLNPKGSLKTIDIQNAENLGVAKIEDFTWKDLLDGYACAVCGRCHDACPAQVSGKPLSPRELILDIKDHLLETGPALLKSNHNNRQVESVKSEDLVGEVIKEDAIWACTTCRACQEVCPSYNKQMTKVIDLRRNLQMRAKTEVAKEPLKNLRMRGHPWRGTTYSRTDWAEGLGIKVLSEDSRVDILYWVGCTEALDDRSLKVAQSVAKLMKLAGVNFGILGDEEMCCGDPARRLGSEHLFQMAVANNIQLFQSYDIKKIVTACPHCFNTLKNEYPQFGRQFEVVHHSQFLSDLVGKQKLKIKHSDNSLVTYHESCYLGRYNDIYKEPRQVLSSIPGINLVEMKKNHQQGFCCGGGGGRMWLEENIGQRINEIRLQQAIDTKAQIVATACPFCLQMFEDAAKAKEVEGSLKVRDIAEILAGAVDYELDQSRQSAAVFKGNQK